MPEGREKPWGTAHAVLAARRLTDGPIAVINADDYYGPGAFQSIYQFLETACDSDKYDFCMAGYNIENTLTENGYVSRGVCQTSEEGLLKEITERTKIQWQGDKIVYTEGRGRHMAGTSPRNRGVHEFLGFTQSMMERNGREVPCLLRQRFKRESHEG